MVSSSPRALRIVIVAPEALTPDAGDEAAQAQAERSRSLRIGLLQAGYNIVAVLPADMFLPSQLAQIQPDMVIIDAESQARDTLEHVVVATREERRPIVMFTDDSDTSHVQEAIASGVTAYVVAGLAPERVMTGVRLDGAFLLGSRFEGVDLSGTVGLEQAQLDLTCGDAATVLPAGLTTPARWPCAAVE